MVTQQRLAPNLVSRPAPLSREKQEKAFTEHLAQNKAEGAPVARHQY